MPDVPLTEKLLVDAGGWDVLKHAKALREMGRVVSASYVPPVLRGFVREGDIEYRAGLKIEGPTRVENLCSCRPSREYGTICAHSVAVGLSVIAGRQQKPAASVPVAAPASRRVSHDFFRDDSAPASLYIVLPPNFAAAWAKGVVMLGLEVSLAGQRGLLHAVARGRRLALHTGDYAVVDALAQITGAAPTGMTMLPVAQFATLLTQLRNHPRITLGRASGVRVREEPMRPVLDVKRAPDGGVEIALRLPPDSELLTTPASAWLWQAKSGTLTLLGPEVPSAYRVVFSQRHLKLDAKQAAAFLVAELPMLRQHFALHGDTAIPGDAAPIEVRPAIPVISLEAEGSLQHLVATIQAIYGEKRIITVGLTPERELFTWIDADRPQIIWGRNIPAERAAQMRVESLGFRASETPGQFVLRGQEAILTFFGFGLPTLQRDWKVRIGERFQRVTEQQVEIVRPQLEIRSSGENWFDLEYSLVASGSNERFSGAEIARLLQMGGGRTRLRNGKFAVVPAGTLDDLQKVLLDCDPGQPRAGVFRIDRQHSAYLEGTLAELGLAATTGWEKFRRSERRLAEPSPVSLPAHLEAIVRPYQREGIAWLTFLARNGLGGVLADEMGLGKTLQTLAFVEAWRAETRADRPSLVVCPTSLLENWRREAARFTPDLRVVALHGPERSGEFAAARAADLVLTSYGLVRRDAEFHASIDYATAILDEAHQIKNPDSQTARAAFALRAAFRFVLTGTPMENSVRDVWSVMQFALPGYLGKREDFRDRYENPIMRDGDTAARSRLARRLRPVLLRRRKRDVAKELPEKIEQVAWCTLTPLQAAAYREVLEQGRRKIEEADDDRRGRMLILSTLLRLRQVCCDLRLIGVNPSSKTDENAEPEDDDVGAPHALSAKTALLAELLEEAREGGHRVLIFSQFVSMLTLLREHLNDRGTPYCYLDGSTRDRQQEVDVFQRDESRLAFLISLKAGGTGLNLTAADTVVHFDPWWNPAVEAQATDRAHRIGQTRVVTAYQLIARGTVEEKILNLQRRKREATAAVIEQDDDGAPVGLSLREMRELLAD